MMYAGRYNSKNVGVPQSRNRVYIIGYHRGQCAGEVLSFTQTSGKALKKSQRKVNESTHRKDLAVLLQAVRVDLAVIRDFISLKIL